MNTLLLWGTCGVSPRPPFPGRTWSPSCCRPSGIASATGSPLDQAMAFPAQPTSRAWRGQVWPSPFAQWEELCGPVGSGARQWVIWGWPPASGQPCFPSYLPWRSLEAVSWIHPKFTKFPLTICLLESTACVPVTSNFLNIVYVHVLKKIWTVQKGFQCKSESPSNPDPIPLCSPEANTVIHSEGILTGPGCGGWFYVSTCLDHRMPA